MNTINDRIELSEHDKNILDEAARISLARSGRVYVDAMVGMGSDGTHIVMFGLRIATEYNVYSTVAVFENGKRL
jgi:hypothetical protein